MKYLIAGAGAIGAYLGACMLREGEDVTFFARGPHLRAMQANGVRILSAAGDFTVHPTLVEKLEDAGPVDVIFVGVKAHGLTQLAPQLKPLIRENTTVVSTQNGIPWWYFQLGAGDFNGIHLERVDPGGIIAKSIDPHRVLGSIVYLATEIVEPGVIHYTEGNRISLGEPDGSRSERSHQISETLSKAGFKCPVTPRIRTEIWVKILGNVAFNPISALTRATVVQMTRDPEILVLVRKIMGEVEAVANKMGIELPISIEKRIAGADKMGEHKTSMLQDLEAGRPFELEPVVGAVLEIAERLDVSMPNTQAMYACTKLLEKNLRKSALAAYGQSVWQDLPALKGQLKMNRWGRLIASVIAMIMIANLQYSWALFVKPIIGATGWKLSEVQWGFTFFIAFETWMMPLSGWFIDRFGPRVFMSFAAVLCGIGWAGLGQAKTLTELYVLYSIAGVGAALVYCGSTCVGLKWFPDKLGLSSGLIAAGFGSGAALFIPVMVYIIRVEDYRAAFLYTGIAQGLVILVVSQFLINPRPDDPEIAGKQKGSRFKLRSHAEQFTSFEMLRTPQFYVLYAMMLLMGIGGLMVTAQVGSVADSLGISKIAFTLALTINPLANGAGRIFWGWVSDHAGRERTMIIAFLLQALALVSVLRLGNHSPVWFIVCLAIVFFTWGEIYSLFPAASADFFGGRNASSNYSFLYSSKGVASILAGGLAATLFERTGSWTVVFYGSATLAFLAALMAFGLISMPLPAKHSTAALAVPETAVEKVES